MNCGGCNADVPEAEAEFCWYCDDRLCSSCWERVGHCGHPAAHALNKMSREFKPGDPPLPAPWYLQALISEGKVRVEGDRLVW